MRVVREKGINKLEDGMFDEDPLIRRAATECMCNMFQCEKVFDMFASPEGAVGGACSLPFTFQRSVGPCLLLVVLAALLPLYLCW
jgi:hypothetical protein